jgi:hypothetical protein
MYRILRATLVENITTLYGEHNWILDIETDKRKKRGLGVRSYFNMEDFIKTYLETGDLYYEEEQKEIPTTIREVLEDITNRDVFAKTKFPYIRLATYGANPTYRKL